MAVGKAKSQRAGIISHRTSPDYGFLYETSIVKDARWNIGDKKELSDGRLFRYAKATNIIVQKLYGVFFYSLLSDGIGYQKPIQAQSIGDINITVDAGNLGDYTQDQLRGGYIVIHTHSDANHQHRGVIGNTPSDADGNVTIYLDAPLTHAITTSHGVEVLPNPYGNVRSGGGQLGYFCSVAGIPNVKTDVANQHLWIQRRGPCWCNPYGTLGSAGVANERQVVFNRDGSVCPAADAIGTAEHASYQLAGSLIERQTTGIGGSWVMLNLE